MATPVTRSFDLYLLKNELAAVTLDSMDRPRVYDKIVQKKSPNESPLKYKYVTHEVFGLGPMVPRGETTTLAVDTPGRAGTKETAYVNYGLKCKFSENLLMDEQYGVIKQVVAKMGESDGLAKDLTLAVLLDNGQTTTYFTVEDDLALFSASHTSYGGGAVRSNILATPADLSYTSLQDLRVQMRTRKDNRGIPNPLPTDSILLIIPPQLEDQADALLNANSRYEPTTNYNAVNVLRRSTWNLVVNEYLSSTTGWFLARGDDTGIDLIDRQMPELDTYVDKEDYGVIHSIRNRWAFHTRTWKNIYTGRS